MLYFSLVIDWFSVAINSLWILGLAILLASFSYQYWLATEEKRPLRGQLSTPAFQRTVWLSLTLIGVALAVTSQTGWERVLWTIFILLSFFNLFTLMRRY